MEKVRGPKERIEDFQVILKNCSLAKGRSKFGESRISESLNGGYSVRIPSQNSEIKIHIEVGANGMILGAWRSFDREPESDPKPLTPAEITLLAEPVFEEDRMLDEVIATFHEGAVISPYDLEVVREEEREKLGQGVRDGVINTLYLTPDYCKSKSDGLKIRTPKLAPSVLNSFSDEDWMQVINQVRSALEKDAGIPCEIQDAA